MQEIPSSIKPYLDEIAQCLSDRNASIMVGAGFSMNAKPTFENAKKFPSWQDLGNAFFEKVRGEDIRNAKYNFFDPLKLAYEVESNFGRPVLDSLLRENIPDNDYKPSELHHSLLSLPWTDVFTTNYDTLLERAADSVNERNYKVVVHKDNLVHSMPPRIFKLHGCFSASTPLIISEEDYRIYPQKFAPFVNTVQQTLLENTLCLIGFSGDDPNFLKWVGWIRDNLGKENSPKIYLIGVLNLSASQEKALAQYNITCVDMSLCDDVQKSDHRGGIAKFINYCRFKTDSETKSDWNLSPKYIRPKKNDKGMLDIKKLPNNISQVTKLWRDERQSYPNWLVVPHDLRKKLWSYTRDWSEIFSQSESIPLQLMKDFVYEFLWRKEKSLLPVFDNEVNSIWSSIEADISKDKLKDPKVFHIVMSLLRYYREEGKKSSWKTLFKVASDKFKEPVYIDYLTHEKALYLLMENKGAELTNLLTRWGSGSTSAIWMFRKASILAEVNSLGNARDLLEKALVKTRRKINADTSIVEYGNVSLESYILVLLTNVNLALSIQSGNWSSEQKQEYQDRLNELQQFKCNPRQEMELLQLEIKHEPTPQKAISVTSGFDIGSQRTTRHFSFESDEVLNAFRLLRFFEDAALPFSLPRVNIANTMANNAIKRIATHAPYWAMVTMLRTRDKKSIELIFTRESLLEFDTEYVDELAKSYIDLLNSFVNEESSLYDYGFVLPEVLSRLCCKASTKIKDQVLTLLIKIYSNNFNRNKYDSLNNLVKRLMFSFSDREIISRVDQIVDIARYGISGELDKFNSFYFYNPFSFIYFSSDIKSIEEASERKLPHNKVKPFLDALKSNVNDVRENASITLVSLKNMGLLNKNQIKSLLTKLLFHKDKYGLPENTGYFKFAFIDMFEGDRNIEKAFREFLLDASPLIQANSAKPSSFSMRGRPDPFTSEIVGGSAHIEWSKDELINHAEKLITWWQLDKAIFEARKSDSELFKEMRDRFSLFVAAIDVVIIRNNMVRYREQIEKMIAEFKTLGLDSLSLKAVAHEFVSYDEDDFISDVEDSISSFEKYKVLDALRAIDAILRNNDKRREQYESLLATFIRYSRGQYLVEALQVVNCILKLYIDKLNPELESAILKSLNSIARGFEHLNFEENLALRKSAAKLAHTLYQCYFKMEKVMPSEVLKWKDICQSENEFSEIKNQWSMIG